MRPSQLKKGGGFLDNVDGVWEDYQFTDQFNGEDFAPGKIPSYDGKGKIDKPHTLNLFLTFRVDGADEATTTTIKLANNFDLFAISEDGHVLTMADDSDLDLNQNTAGGKLIRSLATAGFPVDEEIDDDPKSLDLTPCLNKRYRLAQRVDDERTKKFGQKKAKNGKAYDRKDLIFDQFYGEDEAEPVKAAGKPNGKIAAPAKGAPVKGKPAKGPSLEDLAKDTLVGILQANGGSLPASKLSVKVLTAMGKHEKREDVRKLCFSADFLGNTDMPWTYDKAKKTVTLDEQPEEE